MNLVINVIDYLIMLKYFQGMLGKRRDRNEVWFVGYGIAVVLITIGINGFNYPYLNLCHTIMIIVVTSLWYTEKFRIKLLLALLYFGMSILSDIISTWTMMYAIDFEGNSQAGMYAMAFSVVVRYFGVEILCVMKKEKNMQFPPGTTGIFSGVILLSIAGSIGLNIANKGRHFQPEEIIVAVSMFALLNCFILLLIEKMNQIIRDNHEKEMLLQEARFNELYYSELEKSNVELAKIRHDLKNRLSPFYNIEADDIERLRETIRNLYDELEASTPDVLTRNKALNSILKIKFEQAQKENVQIEYKIAVPKKLGVEYGDMGILFGNLLDNAIEACRACQQKKIKLYVELKSNTLIVTISNTKSIEQKGTIGKTSKKNALGHGIGLKSVLQIVNKYSGTMDTQDYGDYFEAKMLLYGAEGENYGERQGHRADH